MKMLRLTLLLICTALVLPALAQAQDCTTRCQNEYFQCVMTTCGGTFCGECDSVYFFCMNTCQEPSCVPPGGTDDTLGETHCCSGQAVPGSTTCSNPDDYNTTWESCTHICA